ncbi:MAG TPA: ATP-binding protein [Candidatus Dormibacteraeota bacterium]|nr:ATP-binding protein [Candidatus Dormibacteraeota bacterium]
MPIRLRLALILAAGTALLFAAGATLMSLQLGANVVGSVDANLDSQFTGVTRSFPSLVAILHLATGGPTQHGQGSPALVGTVAQIVGPGGVVVVATRSAGLAPLLTAAQLSLARGSEIHVTRARGHQPPLRLVAGPIATSPGWVAVVGASLGPANSVMQRTEVALAGAGIVVVALAGFAAWLLAGAALRPVERMRRQAAAISDRDLETALAIPGTHDEIAALAETMNGLLRRLQGALARQRTFVADAGHELRTPLAVLRTELELAARPGRSADELREAVRNAVVETDRVTRLADDLLLLARRDGGALAVHREPIAIRGVLEAAVRQVTAEATAHGVHLALTAPPGLVAPVDPARIRQAIDNLLVNALRVAPPWSTVTVAARAEGGSAVLEVLDQGPGFPEDFLPEAFTRFSRPDDARGRMDGGAGLGLAIVLAVAEAHEGTAQARNRPEGGAAVQVTVPLA